MRDASPTAMYTATSRRRLLAKSGWLAGGAGAGWLLPQAASASTPTGVAAQSIVRSNGAQFLCRDTGGDGPVVILLHPATGSALIWEKQWPAFMRAGLRTIAYSRLGHAGSSPIDPNAPGSSTADLLALADALDLERFHLVGSAAGGFLVPDACLAAPDRIISATIASSFGGFTDPEYRARLAALKPPGFDDLPASFRELSPEYRAADPVGAAHWEALERVSKHGPRTRQLTINDLKWDRVAQIETPVLFFTGGADLYMPPALLAEAASHFRNCTTHVIPNVGHSAYWERPDIFNALVLDFIGRHAGGA